MHYRHFAVEEIDGVTVLTALHQNIVENRLASEMGTELVAASEGEGGLALDWSRVAFPSSAYLGKVIYFERLMKQKGRPLVLTNIRPDVFEIFLITKLNKAFNIRKTLDEGVAFLREPA